MIAFIFIYKDHWQWRREWISDMMKTFHCKILKPTELVNFMSFWKRKPELRKHPHQIGLLANLWWIFLIDNWCGRVRLTVGSITPLASGPGCYGKQSMQVKWTKPGNSTPSMPLHQFLPLNFCPAWVPALTSRSDGVWHGSVRLNKTIPP